MPSTRSLPEAGARPARAGMAKEPPKKLFYKIGSVCELTGTQPYILRFWESEFPQLAPQKSRSGQRLFRDRDIQTVLRIKQLLYEEGYTIAGARKRLEQEEAERGAREGARGGDGAPAAEVAAAATAEADGAAPPRPRRDAGPADAARESREMRRAIKQLRRDLEWMLRRLGSP